MLEGGKSEAAAQQLSNVIASGKLPTAQMARALYYRGVAYRKLGKPAQAIADLTSALWIKNGLDAGQRNDALLQRAGAYREAGLTDQAEADEKRVAATASATRTAPRSPAASAQAETARQQEVVSSGSSGSLGVGSFFGALFGGGPSSQEAAPPAGSGSQEAWTTRASRAAPPSAALGWADSTEVRKSGGGAVASSSWTTGSTGAAASKQPQPQPLASPPAAQPVVRTATGGGKYHVQIATARSRKEAEAIAQQVGRINAPGIKARALEIEEALVGNMGTLYRVRLGPFADAGEMRAVCGRLREAGFDCLMVDH
jgi:cell division septation protein DedD